LLSGLADAAFVSSTDAPFVDPHLARRLDALRGDAFDCVVPRALGHDHPLAAVYACAVLPAIEARLAANRLRLSSLFDSVRTRFVGEDELRVMTDPSLRALRNVNTPEELDEARAEAEHIVDRR
jgi:molybdopterin-guanine dinucleotide biosynthesis protein A